MTELPDYTAVELVDLYRRREASPLEVVEAVLTRVNAIEPVLNTYAARDDRATRAMAEASEQRWARNAPLSPLDGVPVSIKDLVLTRGLPTGRGTITTPPDPGGEDAPIAARLRESGAVIMGKTTVSELGWKGVGDNPATGVTRNPWDPERTPGASSAGAAAGVAAGLATLGTGSDGGGSIRIPASFCGVYGLKPTHGAVPSWPPSPVGSLSHLGPLTRCVDDAVLAMNLIAQPDSRDWTASPRWMNEFDGEPEFELRGRRIAFSPTLGYAKVDPEVAEIVRSAARAFEEMGAHVELVEEVFEDPISIYRPLFLAAYAHFTETWDEKRLSLLDPGLRDVVDAGRSVDISAYLRAVGDRERFATSAQRFFDTFDLLLTPTMPVVALPVGMDTLEPTESVPSWLDWNPFTYPFNLSQQPAASLPCGFTAEGLPVGLQIVAAKHRDTLVLNASRAFESRHPFRMPDPNEVQARLLQFQNSNEE